MAYTLRTVKGDEYKIDKIESELVVDLKKRLSSTFFDNKDTTLFKLIHKGTILKDDELIDKYNIQDNEYIVLFISNKPLPNNKETNEKKQETSEKKQDSNIVQTIDNNYEQDNDQDYVNEYEQYYNQSNMLSGLSNAFSIGIDEFLNYIRSNMTPSFTNDNVSNDQNSGTSSDDGNENDNIKNILKEVFEENKLKDIIKNTNAYNALTDDEKNDINATSLLDNTTIKSCLNIINSENSSKNSIDQDIEEIHSITGAEYSLIRQFYMLTNNKEQVINMILGDS